MNDDDMTPEEFDARMEGKRATMRLRIDYPALTEFHEQPVYEHVEATHVEGDLYELRNHTIYIPLAPGDVVRANDRSEVLGIASLAEVFTYDVDFMLPANIVFGKDLPDDDPAQRVINATTAEWQREAWCTQHTGLSFYVSAQGQTWLEDRVVLCPYVDDVQMVRYPKMDIDFNIAVANADLGDLTKGPWA